MKLHTKYQRPGPSGFRQEDFLSFQLKYLFFGSCDLDGQWTGTIWTTLKEDLPRIITVKFRQNPNSGFWRRCCLKKLFTDGHTTDKMWSQKLTLSQLDRSAKNRFSKWLPERPSWISDRKDFSYFLFTRGPRATVRSPEWHSHCRHADVMQHFSNPIITTKENIIIWAVLSFEEEYMGLTVNGAWSFE